jgi:hypothetical protein
MTTTRHRADRQAGRRGGWLRSPAVQGIAAFGIYLAVWAATGVRPLIHHVTRAQLDQQNPDPNFYVWCLRWWPYAIGHGLNPLYTDQVGAPAGHALAWVTTVPPLALAVSPLTLLAGPVVSFNLLVAVALPLTALAAFVLCRRLTGQFWPALAGGTVFGFSAFEMSHDNAGQINMTYSLLIPLLAYVVLMWRDEAISARTLVILAGLTMAVQFYLFIETFADMTAILAVSLVAGFALAGRAGRPAMLHLGKLLGLAYAGAIVLAAPYLGYALVSKAPKPPRITGLDLAALVVPRPGRTFGIGWLTHAAAGPHLESAGGYVGVPLLVLAILLAVTGWSSKLIRFLSCMLAVIVVAAIGPVLYVDGRVVATVPWASIFHLPIVRNAYPARLMLFAVLALAVATALWLARPATLRWARSARSARWALAGLVVAAVALNASPVVAVPHTTVPAFISGARQKATLSPGEIVVVVSRVRNAGMLWQAQSDFYTRLAGGFINAGFSHRTDLPQPVQNLAQATPARVASFEAYVKSNHVGAILLDAEHEPRWVGIFWRLGLVGHRVGNVVVYPTDGCQACRTLDWAQLSR